MDISKVNFRRLWVETEKGEIGEVDLINGEMPPVEQYPYAVSRFPQEVRTVYYRRRESDGLYGGKDQMFEGTSTFNGDALIIALVRGGGTWWTRLFGRLRKFSLGDAIILYTTACERCLNALYHQYGVSGGYPEFSEEWCRCNTTCVMCGDLPTPRRPRRDSMITETA